MSCRLHFDEEKSRGSADIEDLYEIIIDILRRNDWQQ